MPDAYLAENLAELWLDDLLLLGETLLTDGTRFTIKAQAPDATWGNPIPVTTEVQRWMTDGAVASISGYQNRTIAFTVILSADDSPNLAAAERALVQAARSASTLTWIPPEGDPDAPASVFELWTVTTDHQFDLNDEQRLARRWLITCVAKPWVRAQNPIVAAALTYSGSPTTTPVDACTSTSGWTGGPNVPTTSGGAVRETVALSGNQNASRAVTLQLLRTGAVTGLDTTPYLQIDMSVTGAKVNSWSVLADTVPLTKVGQVGSVSYWQMPVGVVSLATLMVVAQGVGKVVGGTAQLAIADVSKTDTVGGVGSRKQLTRSLAPGGSVPTAGSIKVASPDATPLHTVLLYTAPDNGMGYNPGLRQYRTSGNTQSAQPDAVSGFRESLTAGLIGFTIPATVVPQASYAVVARVFASAIGTSVIHGTIGTGGAQQNAALTGTATWTVANTYQWVVLGSVTFPYLALPDESLVPSFITLVGIGGTGVALDEVYLLDTTHGACTAVDCGTNTRLWIDAPDASSDNVPHIFVGTQDDRSDAAAATSILWKMNHPLEPDGSIIFTVVEGVNDAAVSWIGYPRGHTHPPVDNAA